VTGPGVGGAGATPGGSRLAYFWGQDAFSIEQAVAGFAVQAGGPDMPLEVWRSPVDDDAAESTEAADRAPGKLRDRILDDAASRLGTATLFGGGTLVVIRQPAGLIRETAARERLLALIGGVPDGNGLCFSDLVAPGAKGPAGAGVVRDAVAAAGGQVREFPALTQDRMEAWVVARAGQLGIGLGPGAAGLLAERVGSTVREGDADRRRQTELANAELEKLALYRPGGVVTRDDVIELVSEAIPGSMWAFLDATGTRKTSQAATLAARLQDEGAPMPVLVSQLHRRIRDLLMIREHLDTGSRPGDLVRQMGLQPFRAQKLSEQAVTWSMPELEGALEGLVELDLRSKGITLDGSTAQMSETRDGLALQIWLAEHVRPHRGG
jgi:DNA polymerase III delta subunit